MCEVFSLFLTFASTNLPPILFPTSLEKAASFTTGPISWFTASHALSRVLYAKRSIVANGNQEQSVTAGVHIIIHTALPRVWHILQSHSSSTDVAWHVEGCGRTENYTESCSLCSYLVQILHALAAFLITTLLPAVHGSWGWPKTSHCLLCAARDSRGRYLSVMKTNIWNNINYYIYYLALI